MALLQVMMEVIQGSIDQDKTRAFASLEYYPNLITKIDFSRGCEGPERGPVIQVDEYPAPSLFSAISGMGLEKSAE
ncbi:hypothetical protein Pmar_PMAR015917 [Perkinsus marinus ATCC 50983]|uniref:Uncharacterized protein n=1 Tax=Perkinsus marinus (strain ATCC 50983 / TXsc) TaxID=423536 RepID=C5L432_PERM5|nr:hypothetical protein Pmar_PMAR015917 [Perkinsus marinus ATCC 50983]EER08498.1 hypothetical protein Pmar_PMAR015917 [Perkinsus marinus ATCC 50983]|eukprot:XP_002776682.1 hypothetical protein Pmar_PMAR015917 [Perkinsus marinus ATCC 50983]